MLTRKFVIGRKYIRRKPFKWPSSVDDYSYCSEFLEYLGTNEAGNIKMKYADNSFAGIVLGDLNRPFFITPEAVEDDEWESEEELMAEEKTSLNDFVGKQIKRMVPVGTDKSFMDESAELILATKHHVLLKEKHGDVIILDERFADAKDWEVVD